MNRKWLALLVIPVVLGVALAAPYLLNLLIPTSPVDDPVSGTALSSFMESKAPDILAVQILGNSTDIVYPELMAALFVPNVTGAWIVSATFLNDSLGPGNFDYYEEHFLTTLAEVVNINNAIYTGLEGTSLSEDSLSDLYYPLGFGLDILYTDGTWIQLFTLQSPTGHIVFLNGTYTGTPDTVNPFDSNYIQRDENWQNGILLEPGTALDDLVSTMNEVFVNHLG
ncbi:MAG: hypothetical protein ACFFD8_08015 [Candidatus Thorarchaeota archaeon]